MASIFTKIINQEIPCYKVYEDDTCIAFLDINPIQPYHTLIVPKKEIPYIFDIDDELYTHLMLICKKIAKVIKNVSKCTRVCIAVQGFDIEHTHIHLIPCNKGSDFDFKNAHPATKEELEISHHNLINAIKNEK